MVDGSIKDSTVENLLSEMELKGSDSDCVYFTLVALYILKEAFDAKKDEWAMLAKKAKDFLKEAGVPKADGLIRKFTLQIKKR